MNAALLHHQLTEAWTAGHQLPHIQALATGYFGSRELSDAPPCLKLHDALEVSMLLIARAHAAQNDVEGTTLELTHEDAQTMVTLNAATHTAWRECSKAYGPLGTANLLTGLLYGARQAVPLSMDPAVWSVTVAGPLDVVLP